MVYAVPVLACFSNSSECMLLWWIYFYSTLLTSSFVSFGSGLFCPWKRSGSDVTWLQDLILGLQSSFMCGEDGFSFLATSLDLLWRFGCSISGLAIASICYWNTIPKKQTSAQIGSQLKFLKLLKQYFRCHWKDCLKKYG